MKTLHQHNQNGSRMETLCGKVLAADIRIRDDILLATLKLDQSDIDSNFGCDAIICPCCMDNLLELDELRIFDA